MTQWTQLVLSHMTPWPIGVFFVASAVSLLFGVIGTLLLIRARRALLVVPRLQERLDTLTHSVSLLTDTTEACFRALSTQVEFVRSAAASGRAPIVVRRRAQARDADAAEVDPEAPAKHARQHRVVGAARRGETLAAIAAREDLSETEVALRLHVNRQQKSQTTEPGRYGSLLS